MHISVCWIVQLRVAEATGLGSTTNGNHSERYKKLHSLKHFGDTVRDDAKIVQWEVNLASGKICKEDRPSLDLGLKTKP
ncbi:unnamed protein product, partial [Iphiclides podalirius]